MQACRRGVQSSRSACSRLAGPETDSAATSHAAGAANTGRRDRDQPGLEFLVRHRVAALADRRQVGGERGAGGDGVGAVRCSSRPGGQLAPRRRRAAPCRAPSSAAARRQPTQLRAAEQVACCRPGRPARPGRRWPTPRLTVSPVCLAELAPGTGWASADQLGLGSCRAGVQDRTARRRRNRPCGVAADQAGALQRRQQPRRRGLGQPAGRGQLGEVTGSSAVHDLDAAASPPGRRPGCRSGWLTAVLLPEQFHVPEP